MGRSAEKKGAGRVNDEPGRLSHLDTSGQMRMVGVSQKIPTLRTAVASAEVHMRRETVARIRDTPKGDVLAAARVAGIQAAKKTWELIPLCHSVALTGTSIDIDVDDAPEDGPSAGQARIRVRATVEAFDRTGVEMEALVAVSTAALTIYDMLKAIDRFMTITDLKLLEKSGGRSGHHVRSGP